MRQYYGPFLASSTYFIRDFSAKSFTIITRKLSNKAFKVHFRKIVYALSSNCQSFITSNDRTENNGFQFQCHSLDQVDAYSNQAHIHQNISKSIRNYQDKKLFELYEGVSLLLFYTCKGVKGNMHSKAIDRLNILWSFLIPMSKPFQDTIRENILTIQSKKITSASKHSITKNISQNSSNKKKLKEQIQTNTTNNNNMMATVDTTTVSVVEYNELNENIVSEIEMSLKTNESKNKQILIINIECIRLYNNIYMQ